MNCYSHCSDCTDLNTACDVCKEKGLKVIEPALRPCTYCMEKGVQWIKAAVICISQDSESRNAGTQKQLIHEKEEKSDPFFSTVSPVPDAVHVAKRKRQSFSNWFLLVNSCRINLVQLRELRNDSNIHSNLAPLLPLSAVRNRDRQDVESIMQISTPAVGKIIQQDAQKVTHTAVPGKYRLRDDNKRGVLNTPIGTCRGPLGHVLVSDVMNSKVYKVRANHYPANVTIEMDRLEQPIGITICNGFLYCAESKKDSIAFKDLTGETVVDVAKLTVVKRKEKLKGVDKWNEDWKKKPKKYLHEKLREALKSINTSDPTELQHKTNSVGHQCVKLDKEIRQPVALCFDDEGRMYVSTFTGTVFVIQLPSNLVSLKGTVIASLQLDYKLLCGLVSVKNTIYVSPHDESGGIYKVEFKDNKIEKIASNGGSFCNRVHSLTGYRDHSIAFSDTGDCKVKVFNPVTKECFTLVGDGQGAKDGSKAQFSQPTEDLIYCGHIYRYASNDK